MAEPTEAEPTLWHVEEQEVYYRTYAVDSARKDIARKLVEEKNQGEVVGRKLVDKRVTNVHPVTDRCADQGCYQPYPECPSCAVALAPAAAHAGDCEES